MSDYSNKGTISQREDGTWGYILNIVVGDRRTQRKRLGLATEQEAIDGLEGLRKELREGTLSIGDGIGVNDWGLRPGSGNRPWVERAACRGMDTKIFFPGRGESNNEALAICKGCPVKKKCLDWRMENCTVGSGFDYGIWGGTTGKGRARLRGWKT